MIFTDCSKAVLLWWIIFVIWVSCLLCFFVCWLKPCGHMLGKGSFLGSLVCDILLCFCYFPMWCPGSGVVLDCIDSWFLPFSLFSNHAKYIFIDSDTNTLKVCVYIAYCVTEFESVFAVWYFGHFLFLLQKPPKKNISQIEVSTV